TSDLDGKTTDGTAGPVFMIDSVDTIAVARNAPNDYTINGEIRLKCSGGTFRIRSIVNHRVELECDLTPGERPVVEILRGLP
ncbi:MAG: hypothetical protein Q4C47_09770, partial [Planctomycetia bacterium]|nr:hypothetical protein [Planctomycetia bacterium]